MATTSRAIPRGFNPRSREGSDINLREERKRIKGFNPRSREGSDQIRELAERDTAVSIHAPAKGATRTVIGMCVGGGCFNPRSREGSDARRVSLQYL